MSAIIHHSYLDFFSIAVEAYESKHIDIYNKLMMTLISNYKRLIDDIELSSASFDKENSLSFSQIELEAFYEEMYDAVDVIKLYKVKFKSLDSKEVFSKELYTILDKLHLVIIENIDRVSVLEVKEIQKIQRREV